MDEEAGQRDVGSARCEPGFAEASVVSQRLVPLIFATHRAEGASIHMKPFSMDRTCDLQAAEFAHHFDQDGVF